MIDIISVLTEERRMPCQIERGIRVIRILICDDDVPFLNRLHSSVKTVIAQTGVDAKIHIYSSYDSISTHMLKSCDIAFLDVDFSTKKYTGLDIAKNLRSLRPDAVIIFVTNYVEYAPEGYEVSAFRYILKSELQTKLKPSLELAITQLQAVRETIKIKVYGELIDIRVKDILYLESVQHTVVIHVMQDPLGKQVKQYQFYSSLTDMEYQLEPQGFLRVHKSYLVNMEHIRKFQCRELELFNGIKLRVGAANYANQKDIYLRWKGW